MSLISVVVPCYNEEEVLPLFYKEIKKISAQMMEKEKDLSFEYLFINDGSKDKTLEELRKLASSDRAVRYISFSRNFGKESGIYAGLSESHGDYVVVMDADLQHPPAFLPKMYNYVKNEGYDCATTRRVSRKGESKVRTFFAHMFYRIVNKISDVEIVDGAQDFRFMKRKMVDSILRMTEYNRFSKGIFSWVGFNTKYIEYENVERAAGTSAWSFKNLFLYSIEGIVSFSTFLLLIPMLTGFLELLATIILLIIALIRRIALGAIPQYALLFTALFLGITGISVLSIGIYGIYISKIHLEVKHRPIYIAKETEKDLSFKEEKR